MTRCVKAMINIGIQELGLKKIEIFCAEGNHRSRAIPERLGFMQEGVIRRAFDLYGECVNLAVYGLLVEEWKAE
ncbi:ribosomal-protein-serine N-acetyltransferase [Candidatus Moduliflexus flocculans]|uniref:Ribosomal-protein-serine N-acetyltransferase n=1 Tax=Candidatus Moduliflexus flocculans TaxID=1499966 RepID=A0A0S6VWS7_9BACT|nr:ribosomal-protein-serine N-acetyltransferase [Candidatus Moduliflexus flocculans]